MNVLLRPEASILGESAGIEKVRSLINAVAPYDVSVIIRGESGTGKDLVAREIHYASDRRAGNYLPVNMGAMSRELICSRLFGHERGAFTGATARRRGVFELAHGGSLFLDEIGTLGRDLQANLLRVLETRSFKRVGGASTIHTDVRFLAATNLDLHAAVEEGSFREDLFHRLNVFEIMLPPLRDRGDDAVLLAEHFLLIYAKEFDMPGRRFSPAVRDSFREYRWPGNVRELENLVLRMTIAANHAVVGVRDLPAELSTVTDHSISS